MSYKTALCWLVCFVTPAVYGADSSKTHIWISGGPVRVSNPTEAQSAVRLALGIDVLLVESRFFVGAFISKPFLRESFSTASLTDVLFQKKTSGKLSSLNFFATGGYYLIPSFAWMRLAVGQAWVSSDTEVSSRLVNTLGAGIGFDLSVASILKIGIEGMYEFRGGDSPLFIAAAWLSGEFPNAHQFSVNARISFLP